MSFHLTVNRLGFPLLVSGGLVLGMLLAPQAQRVPTRIGVGRPAEILLERATPRVEPDIVAQVLEGFLVDALGTERDVLTRVCLVPTEAVRELPWRVRAELLRSEEILGWAARVPVECKENPWTDSALGARWRDKDGRVVLLSTYARPEESSAELMERHTTALESLRQVSLPEASLSESAGVPSLSPAPDAGAWIAASSLDSTLGGTIEATEADMLQGQARAWRDRDGIEHRVNVSASSELEPDGPALLRELLTRYPPR